MEDISKLSKFMNIKFVKRKVDNDYTIDHTASVILLDKELNEKVETLICNSFQRTKNIKKFLVR